jgi:hypothetical protein
LCRLSNWPISVWPQLPIFGAAIPDTVKGAIEKAELENFYREQVCSGKILLTTAQREIADDWVAAYKKRIGPEPESEEQGNFSSEHTNRWVSAGKEVMRPSMLLKLLGQSASSIGQRASG